MVDQKEYLTKERFEELSKELDQLKKVKRREVAESLEYAKSLGDLSENAEYHEARDMQAEIEDRIAKIENVLKSAEIVSDTHSDKVTVGSTVVLQRAGDKGEQTFTIVGSEEIDVSLGKVSIHSPLGDAIVGKKKGDTFSFSTPKGKVEYKITAIK
ncbi:MAG: transcription elongation factor GreA [Candidatus Taylorbacteria bacterium RIFCSPHIGHO2_01_FULL_45_63]|uniref:Transcription elongation factor GreA n=1 Tax=Candidatus Taylorbacteria bacterium RIFCSPHIGHO2_02_FULL_45_35 TaxID=1802311 RepID=A0A1G2MW56_9BACT|nr:MAG: transcription elongation factor GreA [Candidatus Taylorbacteria bacterium RIFCSPHIGHO2_01_FULL_45_63]OHA28075.1 MAG: transcription elongation factor GreA [Candidatus Taylorbacteria bacterium RIFCSPHIGHO2_02_FULL_45_35]OHA34900.1 MAG: transcription elongation factor GreA [Candidatus Taylorbacteria bacterium RIFCSPLOWO2_01_FULL_45_34b]